MLDAKLIRSEPERVKEGARAKNETRADVDRWLLLDAKRREMLARVEALKAERNAASREIGRAVQAGGDAGTEKARMRELGEEVQRLDEEVREVDQNLDALAEWFPNLPHPSVPRGDETENQIVRTWGDPVRHAFPARAHDTLGIERGWFDFEAASRMSGSGFAVFKGTGARLERALIQFFLDVHTRENGFIEVSTPFLVRPEAVRGTGQLPKLADEMYRTDADGLWLIPTAEVSITNLHAGGTLAESDLPLKYVGYSPCFRREAGAHGKETRGLTRVHQFDKVELVKFAHPDTSYEELESLTGNAEDLLRRLELAYRVVLLASGDLSFAAAKCYDLEVWAPAAERWLEVSSCSNFEDFQARRADIRMKPAGGKSRFVHTLNGSALALPRTMIALLETHQSAEGAVRVPEALRPYLGGAALLES